MRTSTMQPVCSFFSEPESKAPTSKQSPLGNNVFQQKPVKTMKCIEASHFSFIRQSTPFALERSAEISTAATSRLSSLSRSQCPSGEQANSSTKEKNNLAAPCVRVAGFKSRSKRQPVRTVIGLPTFSSSYSSGLSNDVEEKENPVQIERPAEAVKSSDESQASAFVPIEKDLFTDCTSLNIDGFPIQVYSVGGCSLSKPTAKEVAILSSKWPEVPCMKVSRSRSQQVCESMAALVADWPQSMLQSSSGIDLCPNTSLLLHRGDCGRPLRNLSQYKTKFIEDTKQLSPHCKKVIFPCGCCFAGVPISCLRHASLGVESLLPKVTTVSTIWKDLYRSEKLNQGKPNSFVSKGKSMIDDRAKIVNWMSYVCSKLGFQSSVYFLSVNIFDLYIERSCKPFNSPDLPPIAASAFLQAANVIEVGSDGKLPTLREFVSAAPWLESTSQVLSIQLDMVKVLVTPSWSNNFSSEDSQSSTLTGKTPFDLLLLYLSEIKHVPKWKQLWAWLIESGALIDVYHRCLSVADLACQRGINLTAAGSCVVASTLLKMFVCNLSIFSSAGFLENFCSELFKLSWEDDLAPHAELMSNLFEASLSPNFPLCGEDMGANAPTVNAFLRKLCPEQRITERLIRHQYRVFKSTGDMDGKETEQR